VLEFVCAERRRKKAFKMTTALYLPEENIGEFFPRTAPPHNSQSTSGEKSKCECVGVWGGWAVQSSTPSSSPINLVYSITPQI